MSLQFSDTTNHKGIIQKIERIIYGQDAVGRISNNATLLKQWTADINLALDRVLSIIFKSDGLWQFDDSNHDGYPTITTSLVANQREYTFNEDTDGNLLLEIHKVYVLEDGVYSEIEPINELEESGMYDGQNTTGSPYRYGKKADGIFLEPIPPSTVALGLKVEVSREGSYFTSADTTKKPGFAGLYHEYLAIQPCAEYAKVNMLANAGVLEEKRMKMEQDIEEHYSKRSKDEAYIITPKEINYI